MDVWGFNGTMPGPTIEAVQGDQVAACRGMVRPQPDCCDLLRKAGVGGRLNRLLEDIPSRCQ